MDPAQATAKQLSQLLEKHKFLARTAELRKGQKPTIKASRAQIESWYAFDHRTRMVKNGDTSFTQTVLGFAYPPCTAPLINLELVDISQLRLETHHRGKVFVGRLFTHPVRFQALQTGIEDRKGSADRIGVYNMDPIISPHEQLPKGAIFAVKEPFYKLAGDGFPIIRIDHPSDLVLLDPSHQLVPEEFKAAQIASKPDISELKASGNAAFKQKSWSKAATLYTKAIEECTVNDDAILRDLLRNRAIANINLKCFEQAAADAKAAVIPGEGSKELNAKAYYRAGCASYQLREYNEAQMHFKQARILSPEDPDTERQYRRSVARVLEQKSGQYDLLAISNSVTATHRRLDHASFTAKVEVRKATGRGKGLFATRDAKAGELLFVEKALCAEFEGDERTHISMIMNLNNDAMSMGPHAEILVQLIQDAIRNPAHGAQMLDLYDRGYEPKSGELVDGTLVVDSFQAHQILAANIFSCAALRSTDDLVSSDKSADASWANSCGVWLLASRMNHACDQNTSRAFIGDLMVVHATRDIKEGDELFTAYKRNMGDHEEMKKCLSKTWGFRCMCCICSAEEKTKNQSPARLGVLKDANDFLDRHGKSVEQRAGAHNLLSGAEDLYARLENTYDAKLFEFIPRLGLARLGLWLVCVYSDQRKYKKAADRAFAVLRDYGYLVEVAGTSIKMDRRYCHVAPEVLHAAVYAADAYLQRGQPGISKELQAFARETYRVLYGTIKDAEKRLGAM